ncbi:MAG: GNAT family N-acetyltransferase [Acetatifactor sp.]|nr:GNAT family N-acetyltransferase [Acetatifactor sp.]
MEIRTAKTEDAPAILAIYAPYVEQTVITFEYDVPSLKEFENRIRTTLQKYPYLVAQQDGEILGYAYASAFKGRAAYDWSVETSIYVRMDSRHGGIGQALYSALEEALTAQHICNVCACITYPNPASVRFHEHFGYKPAAHFHASGFKFNAWHDMIWMEKELCPHTVPPMPFIPYPLL